MWTLQVNNSNSKTPFPHSLSRVEVGNSTHYLYNSMRDVLDDIEFTEYIGYCKIQSV